MTQEFDKQPLLKAHRDSIIKKVGFFEVVNKKNETIKTVFPPADIYLTAGWQNNDKNKSGFGLNHIYYKHFSQIPAEFYIKNEDDIVEEKETIINFIECFLNKIDRINEISVFYEEDNKPLLLKSKMGLLVITYHTSKNYYTVTTWAKMRAKGKMTGFLKVKTLEF